MTLNDLYLISQVLAVAALVPSLIYLAVQVRQNTLQARANASYQFLEATGQINMAMVSNKQVASVMRRGLENYDVLDADEKLQFLWAIGQHLQTHSTMYELYKSKMLPEGQWHPVKKDILTLLATLGGRRVWEDFAMEGLPPDFVNYVQNLCDSGETSYSLGKLLDSKDVKP
ncbi:MAG: hypothetical protein COA47_17670 [Robiginitomaculum sp.]|nr:MAG: hypothetical protein COA47_17670 [Robiginitomaculum sp.]